MNDTLERIREITVSVRCCITELGQFLFFLCQKGLLVGIKRFLRDQAKSLHVIFYGYTGLCPLWWQKSV